MKFKVKVEQFLNGLFPACNIATKDSNKDYDGSRKVTLEIGKDGIKTYAHGGTACISSSISDKNYGDLHYSCEEEGTFTVFAEELTNTLKSFRPSEILEVVLKSNELIFSTFTDDKRNKQIQTVPTLSDPIDMAVIPDKFEKYVKVNREIFLEGISKVQFAMGEFETQAYYMCQLFEATKDSVRFAAGSGARFAVDDIEGKSVVSMGGTTKETFILPRYNIGNVIALLRKSTAKYVYVKEADEDAKKNIPAQIVLEPDGEDNGEDMSLVLLNLDKSINYPALDSILGHDYTNKISSDMSDWKWATAGICATTTPDIMRENDVTASEVFADFDDQVFVVKTETKLRSERRVKFINDMDKKDEDLLPLFLCNSTYLTEMVSRGSKSGNEVIVHFEGKSSDSDKKQRPVIIEFPEKINGTRETAEKFSIFFATAKEQ